MLHRSPWLARQMAKRQTNETGAVLVIAAIVIGVLILTSGLVLTAVAGQQTNSALATNNSISTGLDKSALNYVYASLQTAPSPNAAGYPFQVSTTGTPTVTWSTSYILANPSGSSATTGWFTMTSAGTPQACVAGSSSAVSSSNGYTQPCVEITIQNNPTIESGQLVGVTLQAHTTIDCNGNPNGCLNSLYTTVLNNNSFSNDTVFTQYQTVAPQLYDTYDSSAADGRHWEWSDACNLQTSQGAGQCLTQAYTGNNDTAEGFTPTGVLILPLSSTTVTPGSTSNAPTATYTTAVPNESAIEMDVSVNNTASTNPAETLVVGNVVASGDEPTAGAPMELPSTAAPPGSSPDSYTMIVPVPASADAQGSTVYYSFALNSSAQYPVTLSTVSVTGYFSTGAGEDTIASAFPGTTGQSEPVSMLVTPADSSQPMLLGSVDPETHSYAGVQIDSTPQRFAVSGVGNNPQSGIASVILDVGMISDSGAISGSVSIANNPGMTGATTLNFSGTSNSAIIPITVSQSGGLWISASGFSTADVYVQELGVYVSAYQDSVQGNLRTNSNTVYYCGSPSLVSVYDASGTVSRNTSLTANCPTSSNLTATAVSGINLPGSTGLSAMESMAGPYQFPSGTQVVGGTCSGSTPSDCNSVTTVTNQLAGDTNQIGSMDSLDAPSDVTVDSQGNVYEVESQGAVVRMIPATSGTYFGQSMTAGDIYVIAGNGTTTSSGGTAGTQGYSGIGGPATSATLDDPTAVAVGPDGNLYIADTGANRVLMIPQTTGTYYGQAMTADYIYNIAGNGLAASPLTAASLVGGNTLSSTGPHTGLSYGQAIDSPNEQFFLEMQPDGNLVEYEINNGAVSVPWSSGTFGHGVSFLTLQTDGNLVVYQYNNGGGPIWASGTSGDGDSTLTLSNNGDLQLVDSSGTVTWTNNVNDPSIPPPFYPNTAGIGMPGAEQVAQVATNSIISAPQGVAVNNSGVYIADTGDNMVLFMPKVTGTYLGQNMVAGDPYEVVGNMTAGSPVSCTDCDPHTYTGGAAPLFLPGNALGNVTVNYMVEGENGFANNANTPGAGGTITGSVSIPAGQALSVWSGTGEWAPGGPGGYTPPVTSGDTYYNGGTGGSSSGLLAATSDTILAVAGGGGGAGGYSQSDAGLTGSPGDSGGSTCDAETGDGNTYGGYNGCGSNEDGGGPGSNAYTSGAGYNADTGGTNGEFGAGGTGASPGSAGAGGGGGGAGCGGGGGGGDGLIYYTVVDPGGGGGGGSCGIGATATGTSTDGAQIQLSYSYTGITINPPTASNAGDSTSSASAPAVGSGLNTPTGLAINNNGDLFIADTGNNRVVDMAVTSGTAYTQGTQANDAYVVATGLENPTGVGVSPDGTLYIDNTGANQILSLSYDSSSTAVVPEQRSPDTMGGTEIPLSQAVGDIGVDSAGNIYAASPNLGIVAVDPLGLTVSDALMGQTMMPGYWYDLAGTGTVKYSSYTGGISSYYMNGSGGPLSAAYLGDIEATATDNAGDLFLLGTLSSATQSLPTVYIVPSTTGMYYGIAMEAGDVYAVQSATNVTAAFQSDPYPAGDGSIEMAVSPGGNIYVGGNLANNSAQITFTPAIGGTYFGRQVSSGTTILVNGQAASGSVWVSPTRSDSTTGENLESMAVYPDGNLAVSLYQYSPSTNTYSDLYLDNIPINTASGSSTPSVTNVMAISPPPSGSAQTAVLPYDMTISSASNLYYMLGNTIYIDPSVTGTYAGVSVAADQPEALSIPSHPVTGGLATDSAGNVYYTSGGGIDMLVNQAGSDYGAYYQAGGTADIEPSPSGSSYTAIAPMNYESTTNGVGLYAVASGTLTSASGLFNITEQSNPADPYDTSASGTFTVVTPSPPAAMTVLTSLLTTANASCDSATGYCYFSFLNGTIPGGDGVIYIDGSASITGQFDTPLTLAASNNINIVGQPLSGTSTEGVFYGSTSSSTTCTPGTITNTTTNCGLLGLLAGNDITVGSSAWTPQCIHAASTSCDLSPPSLTVEGVLEALGSGNNNTASSGGYIYPSGGVVYATTWAAAFNGAAPSITFEGSVIAQYQPIFGLYEAPNPSTTVLVAGYGKSMQWDPRLSAQAPPGFWLANNGSRGPWTMQASKAG